MSSRPPCLFLAAVAALLTTAAVAAPDRGPTLAVQMEEVSGTIADAFHQINVTEVSLGSFKEEGSSSTGKAAANLKTMISRQLRTHKLPVSDRAAAMLKCVLAVKDGAIDVTFELMKADKTLLTEIPLSLSNARDLATLTGASGVVEPNDPADGSAAKRVLDQAAHPLTRIDGTKVLAASPVTIPCEPDKASEEYGVEIIVDGVALQPQMQDNQAVVTVPRNKPYHIKLYNNTKFDAHAAVSVDGLNSFEMSTARKPNGESFSEWVVNTQGVGFVTGWYINRDEIKNFVVDSAAAAVAKKQAPNEENADLGSVTVTFGRAWPEGTPPPSDEPVVGGKGVAKSEVGTRAGESQRVRTEERKLYFGVIRCSITVLYRD